MAAKVFLSTVSFRSRCAEDEGNIYGNTTLWIGGCFFVHRISTSIQGEHGFRSWADVNQIRSKNSFDRNECMSLLAFHSLLDYIYITICNDIMYSTYLDPPWLHFFAAAFEHYNFCR